LSAPAVVPLRMTSGRHRLPHACARARMGGFTSRGLRSLVWRPSGRHRQRRRCYPKACRAVS
jgi:hypothetical protein